MDTEIYLLRHGETAWSLTGQHTGHTDLALTKTGEQQASQLGERLRGITFSQVLVSPLQRAQQTCELAGFGAVAQQEPNLREWDYGDYEGKTSDEIHELRPDWDVFRHGCPAGESVEDLGRRTDRIIEILRAATGVVAVYSHGHFLRALATRWIGLPLAEARHFPLDTASISILGDESRDGTKPVIRLWNAITPAHSAKPAAPAD